MGPISGLSSITISTQHQHTIVPLTGEVDIVTAAEPRQQVETVHGPVVFNLEHLSFIDAAGASAIIATARNNGGVTITQPTASAWVRRILDICDLTGWIVDGQVSRQRPATAFLDAQCGEYATSISSVSRRQVADLRRESRRPNRLSVDGS
jgi:anti-anti-sigma factor